MPRVSVIVPAYNRARFVAAAVRSVLGQTLRDFEVIVVDDGSDDGTAAVVEAIRDPRIRLFRHAQNLGIAATQNFALGQAHGEYAAFLDSDDLMAARRLEMQAAFLDSHPEVALVGGAYRHIDDAGRPYGRPIRFVTAPEDVAVQLLFRIEIWKGNAMGRTAVLRELGFDRAFGPADDYELWVRMARQGERLANLPQVIGYYRRHPHQTTALQRQVTKQTVTAILHTQLRALGIAADTEDIMRHFRLAMLSSAPKRKHLRWAEQWLRRIVEANRTAQVYPQEVLERAAQRVWRRACFAAVRRAGPYALWKLASADFG